MNEIKNKLCTAVIGISIRMCVRIFVNLRVEKCHPKVSIKI